MPRKGHTEEQILQALRQVEGGEKAVEILTASVETLKEMALTVRQASVGRASRTGGGLDQ